MGEGTIDFDLTGGLAGALIGRGTAKVRLDGTNALVTATIPSFGASVDAKIALSKPFLYDALLVANKVDLEQVIRLAGLREGYVEGTASLNATASGSLSDAGRSRVFVNLQEVAAAVEGVPVKLAAPSRLTWDGDALTIDTLDLGIGARGAAARHRSPCAGRHRHRLVRQHLHRRAWRSRSHRAAVRRATAVAGFGSGIDRASIDRRLIPRFFSSSCAARKFLRSARMARCNMSALLPGLVARMPTLARPAAETARSRSFLCQ